MCSLGRRDQWEAFRARFIEPSPADGQAAEESAEEIARRLGCSPVKLKNNLAAARRLFREIIIEILSRSAMNKGDLQEDLQYLLGMAW